MSELHIDTDWKKQAQEEKKKLAEEQQKQEAERQKKSSAGGPGAGPGATGGVPGRSGAGRGKQGIPPASFSTLVQTLVTQALFYLGDLAQPGAEPMLNLDMAKYQIDTLSVLEEKTANNLTEDEKRILDGSLYEVRMRYVAVASQYT